MAPFPIQPASLLLCFSFSRLSRSSLVILFSRVFPPSFHLRTLNHRDLVGVRPYPGAFLVPIISSFFFFSETRNVASTRSLCDCGSISGTRHYLSAPQNPRSRVLGQIHGSCTFVVQRFYASKFTDVSLHTKCSVRNIATSF